MEYEFLDFGVKENIAWIRINRPGQLNALCEKLVDELRHAVSRIDEDDRIKIGVVTGVGKAFVAGADIKELQHMDSFDYMEYGGKLTKLSKAMRENSKILIGLANGYALGGGNIVILSCDMIIATEDAMFSMAEINVGLFGGAVLLSKIMGRYKAAEFCLLGEQYSAQKANELGLIYKVVKKEELINEGEALIEKLNQKSPMALKYAKKALIAGFKYELDLAYEYQTALMSLLFSGKEQKEGMQAFIEKRIPNYESL